MSEARSVQLLLAVSFPVALIVLVSGRFRRWAVWAPMVTPLASIIGSGFLVSVPLLASRLGYWAVAAIAGLSVFAILVGGALRYNIAHAEPLLADGKSGAAGRVEQISHVVLAGAYFVSVAYYLALLGAFLLKILNIGQPRVGTAIASAIVIGICGTGIWRGLDGVEGVEKFSVGLKLAAILSLLLALALFGLGLPSESWREVAGPLAQGSGWGDARFLMGLLIVVQGFETSRYMSDLYDAPTRIAAMLHAQLLALAIYVVFFLLMMPLYGRFDEPTDVAGFIDVIAVVSPWLPFLMVLAAIASEFSAAVADSIGASGLVADMTGHRIGTQAAYWLIGIAALAVLWLTNVIGLVVLASRAFALFYALQCLVASLVAHRRDATGRTVWYLALSAACLVIAVCGLPAEA